MYTSVANILTLNDGNNIIIKALSNKGLNNVIIEFVLSCSTRISKNKYKILFKKMVITLKYCYFVLRSFFT